MLKNKKWKENIMEQPALHKFLSEYFTANDCNILEEQEGKITVQLTEELDEILMNRPFYWHYIKRIGQQGTPMKVTFITNPKRKEEKGEWIHFGSPRLHQMFHSLKEMSTFTRMYEAIDQPQHQTPLVPWLVFNGKINYQGAQKRDEIVSIGLQLINGSMISSFMEAITPLSLTSKITDYCFTITPIIRVSSGMKRIQSYIEQYVKSQDDQWAEQSYQRLEEERLLLEHFFLAKNNQEEEDQDQEKEAADTQKRFDQEMAGIYERYEPKITLEVINSGVFYLTKDSSYRLIQA